MSAIIDKEFYEKQFFVTVHGAAEPLWESELTKLAEPAGARVFVETYAPQIKSPSRDVAGTYFASWLGRLCAAFSYSLWHDGAQLELDFSQVTLQMDRQPRGVLLLFRLKELVAVPLPEEPKEEMAAMESALAEFYGSQVRPVVEAVAEAAGVPSGSIWGLMATVFYYVLDMWKGSSPDERQSARLEALIKILTERLGEGVYGRKNPYKLKFQYVESRYNPDEKMRVKASCCLAYKTETDHGYCYTCPKLSEEERAQKRQEYRQEQQEQASK